MINTVQKTPWNSRPDLQPCWSIWAPTAGKQPLTPAPRLTPPRDMPWERPQSSLRSARYGSFGYPGLQANAQSGHYDMALHSPPLSPESLAPVATPPLAHIAPISPAPMVPLIGDRSYLIECLDPLYILQFKGERREVFSAPPGVEHYENELVIVDADRGQDLGRISKVHVSRDYAGQLRLQQHEERTAVLNACGSKETLSAAAPFTPGSIVRSATNKEINQLSQKHADERKAVALCCQKVKDKGLDMTVVDAEFQWDRHKLTFFYQADHRIDFRDLVRELFKTYKTRIWMCAVASD